jgi:endonuclease YncB( thermonuclease family)
MLIAIPALSWAAWRGRVVRVLEGDMIVVVNQGREGMIRLHGVDCPNKGQPFFEEAKTLTSYLVLDKTVEVTPVSRSSYGTTALVRVSSKQDFVNKQLISYGMAWVIDKYSLSGLGKEWKKLEELARLNGVGLWADMNPIPPWEWRKQRVKRPRRTR